MIPVPSVATAQQLSTVAPSWVAWWVLLVVCGAVVIGMGFALKWCVGFISDALARLQHAERVLDKFATIPDRVERLEAMDQSLSRAVERNVTVDDFRITIGKLHDKINEQDASTRERLKGVETKIEMVGIFPARKDPG